jgi:hypothetical protein
MFAFRHNDRKGALRVCRIRSGVRSKNILKITLFENSRNSQSK